MSQKSTVFDTPLDAAGGEETDVITVNGIVIAERLVIAPMGPKPDAYKVFDDLVACCDESMQQCFKGRV